MLKVLKFGGTSVGTLERIQNVANIIKDIVAYEYINKAVNKFFIGLCYFELKRVFLM